MKKYIEIISDQEPHWKEMITKKSYKEWEQRRINNERPVVTTEHQAWYRIVNGKLDKKVWESVAK